MREITREKKQEVQNIIDTLEIDDEMLLDSIMGIKKVNDILLDKCIKREGANKSIAEFSELYNTKILGEQEIKTISNCIDENVLDWEFLNENNTKIIKSLYTMYQKSALSYQIDKSNLMIIRKQLGRLIEEKGSSVNAGKEDIADVMRYLINNYSYEDTINTLGFNIVKNGDGTNSLIRKV